MKKGKKRGRKGKRAYRKTDTITRAKRMVEKGIYLIIRAMILVKAESRA